MLATFKYHFFSILVGLAIFAVTYFVTDLLPSKINGGALQQPTPSIFTTIDVEDKFDLMRLAATNSLHRDTVVRWGFPVSAVCAAHVNGLLETDFQEIAKQSALPSTKLNVVDVSRWSDDGGRTVSQATLCGSFLNLDAGSIALTNSDAMFKALQVQGVSPTIIAVATQYDDY